MKKKLLPKFGNGREYKSIPTFWEWESEGIFPGDGQEHEWREKIQFLKVQRRHLENIWREKEFWPEILFY